MSVEGFALGLPTCTYAACSVANNFWSEAIQLHMAEAHLLDISGGL